MGTSLYASHLSSASKTQWPNFSAYLMQSVGWLMAFGVDSHVQFPCIPSNGAHRGCRLDTVPGRSMQPTALGLLRFRENYRCMSSSTPKGAPRLNPYDGHRRRTLSQR